MSRANIPDLVEWLAGFQPELQDYIDHGAHPVCADCQIGDHQ